MKSLNKWKAVLFTGLALIILLLFLNIIMISKIFSTSDLINNLDMKVANIEGSMHSIEGNVYNTFEDINDENKWLIDSSLRIKAINNENKTANVELSWYLRDLSEGEELTFLYRDVSQADWLELPIKNSGGLNYYVESSLDWTSNYETQILAKSADSSRSDELVYMPLQDLIENRYSVNADLYKKNVQVYEMSVSVETNNDLDYFYEEVDPNINQVSKAEANLLVEGKAVMNYDLLSDFSEDEQSDWFEIHYEFDLKSLENKLTADEINDVQVEIILEDSYGITYQEIVNLTE